MTNSAVVDAITNAASYTWGNCTYYVAKIASWVPAGLGNANEWLDKAHAKGFKTSSTPEVGSVVVYRAGQMYSEFGHVAYVTAVHPGSKTFDVSEMNVKGLNITDVRTSTLQDVLGFILPPAGTQVAGVAGATAGAPAASSDSSNCGWADFGCWVSKLEQDATRAFWIAAGLALVILGIALLVVEDVERGVKEAAPAIAKAVQDNPEVVAA